MQKKFYLTRENETNVGTKNYFVEQNTEDVIY